MSIFEPISGMEFQKKYGTPSIFGLVRTMHYVSGVPIFDDLMKKEKEYYVDVTASKNALSIKFSKSIVSSTQIAVPTAQIVNIILHDKEQIFKQKESDVVGSALVGGLLFGSVGAIVGAAAGSSTVEKAAMPDLMLEVVVDDDGKQSSIVLGAIFAEKAKVVKFLDKNFPEKLNVVAETKEAAVPKLDKLSQLEKLAALKNNGILTEEEFLAEKAKILNS